MSSYVEQNLGPNEKVIIKAKFSKISLISYIVELVIWGAIFFSFWNSFSSLVRALEIINPFPGIPALVLQILAFVFTLGIPIIVIIKTLKKILSFFFIELVVTNKRVLGKVGIFSVKALDYPIEKVDNISLKAGFFGRIFKYYDLSIKSASLDGLGATANAASSGIVFKGVENAVEFKNHITLAIEQHAEEARRLQAEEIAKAMARNENQDTKNNEGAE